MTVLHVSTLCTSIKEAKKGERQMSRVVNGQKEELTLPNIMRSCFHQRMV